MRNRNIGHRIFYKLRFIGLIKKFFSRMLSFQLNKISTSAKASAPVTMESSSEKTESVKPSTSTIVVAIEEAHAKITNS